MRLVEEKKVVNRFGDTLCFQIWQHEDGDCSLEINVDGIREEIVLGERAVNILWNFLDNAYCGRYFSDLCEEESD